MRKYSDTVKAEFSGSRTSFKSNSFQRQSNSSGTLSGGEETPIGVRKARFH